MTANCTARRCRNQPREPGPPCCQDATTCYDPSALPSSSCRWPHLFEPNHAVTVAFIPSDNSVVFDLSSLPAGQLPSSEPPLSALPVQKSPTSVEARGSSSISIRVPRTQGSTKGAQPGFAPEFPPDGIPGPDVPKRIATFE